MMKQLKAAYCIKPEVLEVLFDPENWYFCILTILR